MSTFAAEKNAQQFNQLEELAAIVKMFLSVLFPVTLPLSFASLNIYEILCVILRWLFYLITMKQFCNICSKFLLSASLPLSHEENYNYNKIQQKEKVSAEFIFCVSKKKEKKENKFKFFSNRVKCSLLFRKLSVFHRPAEL